MSRTYNPLDWYWKVGGDTARVYYSQAGDYVPVSDAKYQQWISDGETTPTQIANEPELGGVLAAYYPNIPRPTPAGILDGYQQNQADDIFRHKLVKFLFVLHNRVRTLEGQQPHTIAQARNYFRGLM